MQSHWTKNASKNLDHIQTYIARDKPQAAIDTVLAIIETVEKLVEHPALGKPGRLTGTRELIISETLFIVPYRVSNNQIQILRVLHGAMQWPK